MMNEEKPRLEKEMAAKSRTDDIVVEKYVKHVATE